jgi:hypothetical protein
MFRESRFYLEYKLNGINHQTTELYERNQAQIEKRILEEDGATEVKLIKYTSRLI